MAHKLEITPLGAAIVEALPDRALVRRIQQAFNERADVPTSALWPDKRAVERWYAQCGKKVNGVSREACRRPECLKAGPGLAPGLSGLGPGGGKIKRLQQEQTEEAKDG